MTDSRSFDISSNFDIKRLGDELIAWLKESKHLNARGMLLQDGFLVQAQRQGNLRDWVGLDETVQIKLTHRLGTLEVSMQTTRGTILKQTDTAKGTSGKGCNAAWRAQGSPTTREMKAV